MRLAVKSVYQQLAASTERQWLIGLATAALMARLAWIAYSPCLPVTDFATYDSSATALAQGLGYVRADGQTPTAYWPVGYPLFLASIYEISGHSHLAAKLMHALLGTATVLLVYALARPVHRGAARATSALVACWPSQVAYSSLLASENLFTPLFLASIVTLTVAGPAIERPARLVPAGLLIGAASLVRPLGLLIVPAALAWWLLNGRRFRRLGRPLLGAGVLLAGAIVAIAPWTIRNALVMKAFIPISTNGGVNLAVGNNPMATGAYMDLPEGIVSSHVGEAEGNRAAARFAKAYILAHTGSFLWLGMRKIYYLLSRDTAALGWMQFTNASRRVAAWERYLLAGVGQLYYLAGMLIAIAGLFTPERRHPAVSLVLLVIASWLAAHFVYFGDDRFHAPLIPCFALLGGLSLHHFCSRRWGARKATGSDNDQLSARSQGTPKRGSNAGACAH